MTFAAFLFVCAALFQFALCSTDAETFRRFPGFAPASGKPKSVAKGLQAVNSLLSCDQPECDMSAKDAQTLSALYCKALWAVPAGKQNQLGLLPFELHVIRLKCSGKFDDLSTQAAEERAKQTAE